MLRFVFVSMCLALLLCNIPEHKEKSTNDEKLLAIIAKYKKALSKRDKLLSQLFQTDPNGDWLSMQTTITWYSLSKDETDGDPDMAAHGKSRPFMAAISKHVVRAMNLVPGDKVAVISDDGKVAAIVTYWDAKNSRYDDSSWVDIVAPSKSVAKRWSIRKGRIIKI